MTENIFGIITKNLTFSHGEQVVLQEVSLNFRPGRHYILAGPNGAGKSTLMDLLANLKKPAEGSILIQGKPMDNYEPLELARILALAPQEIRLNFSFSVREIVAMGRRPYLGRWGRLSAEDHEVVDQALVALDLQALSSKSVTALSGGERQRVVVARTLAQATPIMLLDEPTSGLDIAHGLALMELAKKRADEGALVITVTHDLNLAAAYGHEFVFLKQGRLVAAGPIELTFTSSVLAKIYDAEAKVTPDAFGRNLAAYFRLPRVEGAL